MPPRCEKMTRLEKTAVRESLAQSVRRAFGDGNDGLAQTGQRALEPVDWRGDQKSVRHRTIRAEHRCRNTGCAHDGFADADRDAGFADRFQLAFERLAIDGGERGQRLELHGFQIARAEVVVLVSQQQASRGGCIERPYRAGRDRIANGLRAIDAFHIARDLRIEIDRGQKDAFSGAVRQFFEIRANELREIAYRKDIGARRKISGPSR